MDDWRCGIIYTLFHLLSPPHKLQINPLVHDCQHESLIFLIVYARLIAIARGGRGDPAPGRSFESILFEGIHRSEGCKNYLANIMVVM